MKIHALPNSLNMKTNLEVQRDVQNAIMWEPDMNAAEIGVTAHDGIVTLSGIVDSYSKKINAENAAKKVYGVKAVAEDIEVRWGSSFTKNDTDIAQDILQIWKSNWSVPENKIKVKVEDGWVKLEGDVEWKYEERVSANAIKNLKGIRGVTNLIKVKSESKDNLEKEAVESALKRNWSINSKDIKVEVNRNNVKLKGTVHSIYQKDEADRLAWNTPGVWAVENDLAVIY